LYQKPKEEQMTQKPAHLTIFLMLVRSAEDIPAARLLIESLRTFGGSLSNSPLWLFIGNPEKVPSSSLDNLNVQVLPLEVPETVRHYDYGDKVYACTRAEELVGSEVRSLVWIDPDGLIVKPPLLFDLAPTFDAAVRPVHIRNVGSLAAEPPDDFWKQVYKVVGAQDIQLTVESYVDEQILRAYFNTHAFAVNPAKGVLQRWFKLFETLVTDLEFQAGPCQDELHHVFLHQAVLSVLLVTSLDPERICLLPPNYNYPYNLQHKFLSLDRQAKAFNDLVYIVYCERPIDPELVDDIQIHEPLRSWLDVQV
jgi:hypothetical protein